MAYPISQAFDAPAATLTNIQVALPAKGYLKSVTVTLYTGLPSTVTDTGGPLFVVLQLRTSTAWFFLSSGWVRNDGVGSMNVDGLRWTGEMPLDLTPGGANTLWAFVRNDGPSTRSMSVAGFVE